MNVDSIRAQQILDLAAKSGTAQLVVQQGDKTLLEYTAQEAPVDVFAVQKGLVSMLFGIAEEKYLLDISDNVNHHLAPEWTRLSPWDEAKLTIETLLQMTTGMDDELAPLGVIGETWRYNNTAYNYLKRLLEEQTGLTMNDLTTNWLLAPLGMSETSWQDRPQQLPDGRHLTGLLSTARDLIKVGQVILGGGQNLLAAHYMERMFTPGSVENPAWGLCWWLNNQPHFRVPMREEAIHPGPIIPSAPPDLVAARGAGENGLYVVPSQQLVVARTAMPRRPDAVRPAPFEQAFWQLMAEAS